MSFILTFEQAVEELIDRLGGRRDIQDRVTDWLNEAQIVFARSDIELPQLDVTNATFITQPGQSTYTLIDGGDWPLGEIIGVQVMRNQTSDFKMARFDWREFRRISTQASSAPVRWTRYGQMIGLDPQPDDVYSILIDYRRKPTLGTLEVGDVWIEEILKCASFFGWAALGEPQQAQATFSLMPAWLQVRLSTPLTEIEWEAQWDDDMGFQPAEFI